MSKKFSADNFKYIEDYCSRLFKSKQQARLYWKSASVLEKLQELDVLRQNLNELKSAVQIKSYPA